MFGMKTIILVLSLSLAGLSQASESVDPKWVLAGKELNELLRSLEPKVTFGGSRGGLDDDKVGDMIVHDAYSLRSVNGHDGAFAPAVIKRAVDEALIAKGVGSFSSSLGSRENGFVNHRWSYQDRETGVVGRLSIWFTGIDGDRATMIVESNEQVAQPKDD